jgi:ribose-phosphate pyrophosphokinase
MIYVEGVPVEIERFPNGESRIPLGTKWMALALRGNIDFCDARFSKADGRTELETKWAEEARARGKGPNDPVQVRLHYENDADLLYLVRVKRSLDDHVRSNRTELVIDYMPYSRMDRQTGDDFSLKYVAELINSLAFDRVLVLEPHSDVTTALLDRCEFVNPAATWLLKAALERIDFDAGRDFLFFPDAGAQKRYGELGEKYRHLVGFKHRGDHGKLDAGYQIMGEGQEAIAADTKIVIVDDLCSYGGTFVKARWALKSAFGTENIYLVVTHLERSVYQGKLLEEGLVKGVFATTSMQDKSEHGLVHLYDIITRVNGAEQGENNE